MQALHIKIRQQTACYRIPTTSGGVWLSYPLPPYSTIFGFLRSVCGQSEITEMSINPTNTKISISGSYQSSFFDYQTMHKFKDGNMYKRKTEPFQIQTLYEVGLSIYVITDTSRLALIQESFQRPPQILSLGRKEDLITSIKINSCILKQGEIDFFNIEKISDFCPALVPIDFAQDVGIISESEIPGILFSIPHDSFFIPELNLRRMTYKKSLYMTENPGLRLNTTKVWHEIETGEFVWIN